MKLIAALAAAMRRLNAQINDLGEPACTPRRTHLIPAPGYGA